MIILYNYPAWKVTMQDSNFHQINTKYFFVNYTVNERDILNRANTEKSQTTLIF